MSQSSLLDLMYSFVKYQVVLNKIINPIIQGYKHSLQTGLGRINLIGKVTQFFQLCPQSENEYKFLFFSHCNKTCSFFHIEYLELKKQNKTKTLVILPEMMMVKKKKKKKYSSILLLVILRQLEQQCVQHYPKKKRKKKEKDKKRKEKEKKKKRKKEVFLYRHTKNIIDCNIKFSTKLIISQHITSHHLNANAPFTG